MRIRKRDDAGPLIHDWSVLGSTQAGVSPTKWQFLGKSCLSRIFFLHLEHGANESDSTRSNCKCLSGIKEWHAHLNIYYGNSDRVATLCMQGKRLQGGK